MLEDACAKEKHETAATIIRLLALTGYRRGEMTQLRWAEVDFEGSCLRLSESKEGASVRPIGLAVFEALEGRRKDATSAFVFHGWEPETPFGALTGQWRKIFADTELADITPHVL
ncbi:MAG: tyrosine-type recombinase/integrase [Erythrobacter sp.]